jgi:hypothetical protein
MCFSDAISAFVLSPCMNAYVHESRNWYPRRSESRKQPEIEIELGVTSEMYAHIIPACAQVGDLDSQKANGVSQFLSHKFLCRAMKTFKSVAKGKQQSEECRPEMLGHLHTMAHWKPPGKLSNLLSYRIVFDIVYVKNKSKIHVI